MCNAPIRPTGLLRALLLLTLVALPVAAHPGSGIAVDRGGTVYFLDTGRGVWKIGADGTLSRHEGPAYHWMALVDGDRFAGRRIPPVPNGELTVVRGDPTLIVASDFPVAAAADGTLYYPQPAKDDLVQIMRLPADGGAPERFATLPPISEVRPDGRSARVPWIHGLAVGPNGSLYYAERHAVKRIAPDGVVSVVAENVTVPDCVRPPAEEAAYLGPALRGLAVAADGAVYVAASGCCAVLKISADGKVSTALRSTSPWSPTAVALAGKDLYVLEYWSIKTERREEWLPRVRKVAADGTVTTVASVDRR